MRVTLIIEANYPEAMRAAFKELYRNPSGAVAVNAGDITDAVSSAEGSFTMRVAGITDAPPPEPAPDTTTAPDAGAGPGTS